MRILGGVLLAVVVATVSSHAADGPGFVCAPASTDGKPASPTLSLADQFGSRDVSLAGGASVCRGEMPSTAILAGYDTKMRPRKAKRVGATATIVTRLGSETLTVKALDEVRVPASDGGTDPGGPGFACYSVRQRRTQRARVAVTGASGEAMYDVMRATHVCVATTADAAPDYVCHGLRPVHEKGTRQAKVRPVTITLTDAYGTDTFRVGAANELCVPALGEPPPPPNDPPFTLSVTPSARTAIAGGKPRFRAVAQFPDGHHEDRTDTVAWSSSDESVARFEPSSTGGVFLDAVGPGTAVISAADLATGIASGDSGGNATLTVIWPLEKLVMGPHFAVVDPGGHQDFTVIGWFTGGFTRNLTQRVTYASSNPAVAVATNQSNNRSRVNAVAAGTANISATDPISGITTTQSGNDAVYRVAGSISYILVRSNLTYSSRFPGQSQRFTARGYYSDGTSLNLTQQCQWSSSDPSVATAPNQAGDRSRIDAIEPGLTFISCTDSISGKQSYPQPFYVLGDLLSIDVTGAGSPNDWLPTGGEIRLTALGHYAPAGGLRNITQDVVWTSRDPEVAIAANAPGDASRFVAVGAGQAHVFATDADSGVSSPDATLTVLGNLVGVDLFGQWNYQMAVGGYLFPQASGIFEFGNRRLRLDEYALESSNPSVIEIVNHGHQMHALAAGTADITARHIPSGIESLPQTYRVKGNLASITLTPATATRGIGEWESFTATGHYPPDFSDNLTQYLVYSSSDESVAVADNSSAFGRSRVRTVGAGTATITAADVATGVFATATITVLPGTIERVTIEPSMIVRNPNNDFSYTAIGHYPDGSTINVTQIVTWSSLDPAIAEAPNPAGNRSRIVGRTTGTATIVASHPSGVSSHDSGDDATFVVRPLVGLSLTPGPHLGPVGMTERYTLVGTFDDATTINLTQQAYYWTEDWSIAKPFNTEGDRSAVLLVAPGFTTVHAQFADWSSGYAQTSGSVAGAFLAVQP